jgi:outer membrane receptor protein involved in Fe transport
LLWGDTGGPCLPGSRHGRKEEALHDAPIAVSAFNQEALEKSKIDRGPNLVLAVPRLQLNATGFHYNYKGYQVSKIINRTSINENIDAKVWGAEFESDKAITDFYLTDDSSGLFRSTFYTEPRTNGVSADQALVALVREGGGRPPPRPERPVKALS